MVLLLYADDILLTGSDETLLLPLVESLGKRFPMKDLGQPSYFLGIELQSTEGNVFSSVSICQGDTSSYVND